MVNKENFNDKMIEWLEEVEHENNIFGEKSMSLIEELADYAEMTELFHSGYHGELDDMDSNKIYIHLLKRICYAPTNLHIIGSCILIIPILRRKIKEERKIL